MDYHKSHDDFYRHLEEQYQLLSSNCRAYDDGLEAASYQIATNIRVLVHDTQTSTSLMRHLGRKDRGSFYGSKFIRSKKNIAERHFLTYLTMPANHGDMLYRPLCALLGTDAPDYDIMKFHQWWTQIVSHSFGKKSSLSRAKLVLNMANKDGGAHVDGILREGQAFYLDVTRGQKGHIGQIKPTGERFLPYYGPNMATMRQIGEEMRLTLEHMFPDMSIKY
jgi:hypothetical protein